MVSIQFFSELVKITEYVCKIVWLVLFSSLYFSFLDDFEYNTTNRGKSSLLIIDGSKFPRVVIFDSFQVLNTIASLIITNPCIVHRNNRYCEILSSVIQELFLGILNNYKQIRDLLNNFEIVECEILFDEHKWPIENKSMILFKCFV